MLGHRDHTSDVWEGPTDRDAQLWCRDINERQRRLAEITEMIHVASLVHDDVLDDCGVRRGAQVRVPFPLVPSAIPFHLPDEHQSSPTAEIGFWCRL